MSEKIMELANKYFKNSYYNQEENMNTKKREMKYIKKTQVKP